MKEEFKPNTWYKLSIRIRPSGGAKDAQNVRKRRATTAVVGQVRVNCNVIGTLNFIKNFAEMVPYGYAVYGSSLKFGETPPAVADRFPVIINKQLTDTNYFLFLYILISRGML